MTPTWALPDFVLARIEDDEAVANDVHGQYCDSLRPVMPYPCNCGVPARVLAECKAKRVIVESRQSFEAAARNADDLPTKLTANGIANGLEIAMKSLGAAWSDHPDYRQEWAS